MSTYTFQLHSLHFSSYDALHLPHLDEILCKQLCSINIVNASLDKQLESAPCKHKDEEKNATKALSFFVYN